MKTKNKSLTKKMALGTKLANAIGQTIWVVIKRNKRAYTFSLKITALVTNNDGRISLRTSSHELSDSIRVVDLNGTIGDKWTANLYSKITSGLFAGHYWPLRKASAKIKFS